MSLGLSNNVLFAPLNIEDKTVGVIGIANKPGEFNKYDINISRILGDLAAVALTYAKSQESLKESEEKFRSLVEKLDDIIWNTDMELRTVYVSPSIEKKLGITQEERMAQTVEETMTPVSLEKATEIFMRELEKERKGGMDPDRTFRIELEYLHKNGTPIWFENVIGWQRDKTGETIRDTGRITGYLRAKAVGKDPPPAPKNHFHEQPYRRYLSYFSFGDPVCRCS